MKIKNNRKKKAPKKSILLQLSIIVLLAAVIFFLLGTFTTVFGDRDIFGSIFSGGSSEATNSGNSDQQWDGIYENEYGTVVIRDTSGNMCQFLIEVSGGDGDGSLTSYAEISECTAVYSKEDFSVTMSLSGDTLTLEQTGVNPYTSTGEGFSGEFSRTGGDPSTVDMGSEKSGLPDTISETVLGDKIVSVYVDPEGRYSAYFPCLFTTAPAGSQPTGGVYLENADDTAHITISAAAQDAQTQEELKQYLESKYDGSATLMDDGSVFFEWKYTDGEGKNLTEVIYLMSTGGMLINVDYVFVTSEYDYYSQFYGLLGISVS